jgi:hypothetical protein
MIVEFDQYAVGRSMQGFDIVDFCRVDNPKLGAREECRLVWTEYLAFGHLSTRLEVLLGETTFGCHGSRAVI